MKFLWIFIIVVAISVDGIRNWKPSKKTKKSVKKAGEYGLQGGLGVIGMTAAMGILSTLEKSLEPGDEEGLRLINQERRRLPSLVWSSPWPYSGMGVGLLILIAGMIRMFRARRLSRERGEPSSMLVLGSKRKAEKNEQDDFVTFGDFPAGQPVAKE